MSGVYLLDDSGSYNYDHTELVLRSDPQQPNAAPLATIVGSSSGTATVAGGSPTSEWGFFENGEITNQPYYFEETIHIETLVDESGTEVIDELGRHQTRTFDTYEHTIYHEDRVDSGSISTVNGQSVAVGTLTVNAWASLEIDNHETVSFLNNFVGGSSEQGTRTTSETASYHGTLTGSVDYVTGQSASGEFEFADSLHAAFHELGSGSSSNNGNTEDWNYDVTGTLGSAAAADGVFSNLLYEDGSSHRTSSVAYSSSGNALLLGSAGGSSTFESDGAGDGNHSSGSAAGTFGFSSSASATDSGASSRVNGDYTTNGVARLEFSGSANQTSRGNSTTNTNSESERSSIHASAIESLYGSADGGGEVNYTFTSRGDRVYGSFASTASAASRSASQVHGTITQKIPDEPDVTTPVRDNQAGSFSVSVSARGNFRDDSLGPNGLGQANEHSESGHVTRVEGTSGRSTSYAGIAEPDEDAEPIKLPPSFGAYSLGKSTYDRTYREDYDYNDDGAGLTKRGTFEDDTRTTGESARAISNAPYDDDADTTGKYSARQDGGTRRNTTSTAAFSDGAVPLAGRTVNSTGTEDLQNFGANKSTLATTTTDGANRSGSTGTSSSKSRSTSTGQGSSTSDGVNETSGRGSGTSSTVARNSGSGSEWSETASSSSTPTSTTATRTASSSNGNSRSELRWQR